MNQKTKLFKKSKLSSFVKLQRSSNGQKALTHPPTKGERLEMKHKCFSGGSDPGGERIKNGKSQKKCLETFSIRSRTPGASKSKKEDKSRKLIAIPICKHLQ